MTFWTPTFAQVDYLDSLTKDDMELIKKFLETVKGYNDSILTKFRESQKLVADSADVSLEAELEDASAA